MLIIINLGITIFNLYLLFRGQKVNEEISKKQMRQENKNILYKQVLIPAYTVYLQSDSEKQAYSDNGGEIYGNGLSSNYIGQLQKIFEENSPILNKELRKTYLDITDEYKYDEELHGLEVQISMENFRREFHSQLIPHFKFDDDNLLRQQIEEQIELISNDYFK